MSDDNQPVSREGRVSRRPLIIVLMFLALIAIVGASISSQARDQKALNTVSNASTTSSVVDDTAYPTVAPTSSTQAGSAVTPAATAAAGTGDCTPNALLAAADASGQAAEGVIDSATVTRFNCIDDYAYARLSAPGLDEAQAYFERSSNSWKLLVLGTSVDPEAQGIPADIVRQLAAD